MDNELKARLTTAASLEETKEILKGREGFDAERIWSEIENHRSGRHEKLDLDELEAISGGADRDWVKDGCAATCEEGSWCWSSDKCQVWDVTYSNFWVCCPDGQKHVYSAADGRCIRCGHLYPYAEFPDN